MLPPGISLATGLLAILSTSAILTVHIILAATYYTIDSVRVTSIVAAVLELVVISTLTWLSFTYVKKSATSLRWGWATAAFVCAAMACVAVTAASAAALAALRRHIGSPRQDGAVTIQTRFITASSVALGLSLACQLLFFTLHFLLNRRTSLEMGMAELQSERSVDSSASHVPMMQKPNRLGTHKSTQIRSASSGSHARQGQSRRNTMATSLALARKSLSARAKPSSAALGRSRSHSAESHLSHLNLSESFDSWDTSSVTSSSRQIVLEAASSSTGERPTFLETIPASPTTSRRSEFLDDLVPPPPVRRSMSFSSTSTRRDTASPRPSGVADDESHIHPLFRSDSPNPPPLASPGTSVVAAPEAGHIITPRASHRSLRRMHSDSLSKGPSNSSPLSRPGSVDSRRTMRRQSSIEE